MRLRAAYVLAAVTFLVACSGVLLPAHAKGGKSPGKPPEWTEEAGRRVLQVFDPTALKAYVQAPSSPPEGGKKSELIVILHGHGGTATGILPYAIEIAEPRRAYAMACEGSGSLRTDRGVGHSWSQPDVPGILACLDAALAKFPIDPARVVVMGHSAGGTMSLETYAARPKAFAGVYTTAAPAAPSGAHKGARIVVNIGTKDPNYADFAPSVAAAQKTVVGRVVGVEDLAHDLPHVAYSQEAVAWLLDSKAPSETLRLPLDPSAEMGPPAGTPAAKGKGGKFRHLLKFEAGGRGAPAGAPAKAAAKAAVVALVSDVKKAGPGHDVGERAAADSQDPLTKDLRGVVTGVVVARYGAPLLEAMGKLTGGEVASPVESDAGWHLVSRDP